MLKSKAIELLGGTVTLAAKAIGISYQAIDKWPDELSDRIADRVLAALAREKLPELVEARSGAIEQPLALVDRRVADLPIEFPGRRINSSPEGV